MCGERWLAVGDAATASDPIAAQGVYKAMASGIHAAERLHQAKTHGKSVANELALYATWMEQNYDEFLVMRRELYSLETRWPDREFWQARTS